jgi:hypothetical protein
MSTPPAVRPMLAAAIRAEINPEYLRELVSQVKDIQRQTRAWCPNCEQHVMVSVPDLPRVIMALTELLEQAEGKPGTASTEDGNITLIIERTWPPPKEPESPPA